MWGFFVKQLAKNIAKAAADGLYKQVRAEILGNLIPQEAQEMMDTYHVAKGIINNPAKGVTNLVKRELSKEAGVSGLGKTANLARRLGKGLSGTGLSTTGKALKLNALTHGDAMPISFWAADQREFTAEDLLNASKLTPGLRTRVSNPDNLWLTPHQFQEVVDQARVVDTASSLANEINLSYPGIYDDEQMAEFIEFLLNEDRGFMRETGNVNAVIRQFKDMLASDQRRAAPLRGSDEWEGETSLIAIWNQAKRSVQITQHINNQFLETGIDFSGDRELFHRGQW